MAKQALQKIEPQKESMGGDDFFMAEQEENKKAEHDIVSVQLNK